MAFKEFGNYDAVGLAELVRKKEVTAKELLDEAVEALGGIDNVAKVSVNPADEAAG